jgi:hypothetical protein
MICTSSGRMPATALATRCFSARACDSSSVPDDRGDGDAGGGPHLAASGLPGPARYGRGRPSPRARQGWCAPARPLSRASRRRRTSARWCRSRSANQAAHTLAASRGQAFAGQRHAQAVAHRWHRHRSNRPAPHRRRRAGPARRPPRPRAPVQPGIKQHHPRLPAMRARPRTARKMADRRPDHDGDSAAQCPGRTRSTSRSARRCTSGQNFAPCRSSLNDAPINNRLVTCGLHLPRAFRMEVWQWLKPAEASEDVPKKTVETAAC